LPELVSTGRKAPASAAKCEQRAGFSRWALSSMSIANIWKIRIV
jgi:hypothetical protein